jgi:hypothetical protein
VWGEGGFVTENDKSADDVFLEPGTKVRYDHVEGPNGELISEYGIVVHCWLSEHGFHDCYVAFFGDSIPTGSPTKAPHVLRYAASVLRVID